MEPRDYESPVELETTADRYFAHCDETDCLYGEAGLALGLGLDLETLRAWYDGSERPEMQAVVRRAYLRIQNQIESSPAYRDRGMQSRAAFLLKQRRLGGYREREDASTRIRVLFGPNADESDFH